MDDVDKRICDILKENEDVTAKEICILFGPSINLILYRLKRLRESELVISRFNKRHGIHRGTSLWSIKK